MRGNPRNPAWSSADHSTIDVTIDTEKYGEVRYTLTRGEEDFARAEALLYGPISPYAAPPPPDKDALKAYANFVQENVMARVWSFNVAAPEAPAHAVTTRLDDRGSLAMIKIALWAQMNAAAEPSPLLPYSNVDNTPSELTVAEAQSLVAQAGAANAAVFGALNEIVGGIEDGTVTGFAQIDAFVWPGA